MRQSVFKSARPIASSAQLSDGFKREDTIGPAAIGDDLFGTRQF